MELPSDIIESLGYINEMKENEINAAAAHMYLLIHRGCQDLDMLDKVSDPLLDAEFAGEEHYMNLVKYVSGFDRRAASEMYALFEDVNGFRNKFVYAAIKILEDNYSDTFIVESIMPVVTRKTDWYNRTIVMLGYLILDNKLSIEKVRESMQTAIDEFDRDGYKLSYLVDKYEDLAQLRNYPNEIFHPLSDIEWKALEGHVADYCKTRN